MGLNVDVRAAFSNPVALQLLRFASANTRHAIARAGVVKIREKSLDGDTVNKLASTSPRGFYSWVLEQGWWALLGTLSAASHSGPLGENLESEFSRINRADALFGDFSAVSKHPVLDLTLRVYPGLNTLREMGGLYPEQAERIRQIQTMDPSVYDLREDHPGWPSEKPDFKNIRGNMADAVRDAEAETSAASQAVDEKYGEGTMAGIQNIVVLGIGANDMYMKDLPLMVNQPGNHRRKLYSRFSPAQLRTLPEEVTADNTLFIAVSRGGETQETIKSLIFGVKGGKIKYSVSYVDGRTVEGHPLYDKAYTDRVAVEKPDKLLLKRYTEKYNGIVRGLDYKIGGRYMWAKGLIVLVPFMLSAADNVKDEYTQAMVDFDQRFWPVGPDTTLFELASHLYYFIGAYNIPTFLLASNHPVLEEGLRQPLQLFDEAVGKINNGTLAFRPGIEMLPFAHAGADGILGSAISAQVYGGFIFNTEYSPLEKKGLRLKDLLPEEHAHRGLTPEMLELACVFPNWAKFTYSGGPNFMLTMDRVTPRNMATLTAFYQTLMYTYLLMNGTNPDSNPNVAMVRATTKGLLSAVLKDLSRPPIEVIMQQVAGLMRGKK